MAPTDQNKRNVATFDSVFRMIESEMPQLIVVAEPDVSAWQADRLLESNPDLELSKRLDQFYISQQQGQFIQSNNKY